jgi:hypothetical protein
VSGAGNITGQGRSGYASVGRYLAFGVLLAMGACTILTAGLLLTRTIEKPSDALVWVGRQPVPEAQTRAAAEPEDQKPLTKDLDPDYIETPTSQQPAAYKKECPAGCEQQGNCNAEEGRCVERLMSVGNSTGDCSTSSASSSGVVSSCGLTSRAVPCCPRAVVVLCCVRRCECPYGYYGPICDKPMFPACKLAPNATEMHCGERMPRSCECFRQCRHFYCNGLTGACEQPRDPWFVRCFEQLAPAAGAAGAANSSEPTKEAVYSDVPEEADEQAGRIAWYRGIRTDMSRERLSRQKATAVSAHCSWRSAWRQTVLQSKLTSVSLQQQLTAAQVYLQRAGQQIPGPDRQEAVAGELPMCGVCLLLCVCVQVPPLFPGGRAMVALPVSKCPDSCNLRGQCVKTAITPEPACLCWQGYTGESCEQVSRVWTGPSSRHAQHSLNVMLRECDLVVRQSTERLL